MVRGRTSLSAFGRDAAARCQRFSHLAVSECFAAPRLEPGSGSSLGHLVVSGSVIWLSAGGWAGRFLARGWAWPRGGRAAPGRLGGRGPAGLGPGPVGSRHAGCLGADCVAVDRAGRAGEGLDRRPRGRFQVTDEVRQRLAFWRGNAAAVHRELAAAAKAGGPAAPSRRRCSGRWHAMCCAGDRAGLAAGSVPAGRMTCSCSGPGAPQRGLGGRPC